MFEFDNLESSDVEKLLLVTEIGHSGFTVFHTANEMA